MNKKSDNPMAVIGAGSWGLALTLRLAYNQQTVRLWDVNQEHLSVLSKKRTSQRYLPGIVLPDSVEILMNLKDVFEGVNDILIVVPSFGFRKVLEEIKPYMHANTRVIWATKGIDNKNQQLLHEVFEEECPNVPYAVLSGPTFAKEVAMQMPTAITLASKYKEFQEDMVKHFHAPEFRVYLTDDVIGVQVGGAVKNVLAIAAGISDGLGYGANARSGIITRGLVEIIELGTALGAREKTMVGLSGLGDLVLTCSDPQSRNQRFGAAIGRGEEMDKAMEKIGQIVEGYHTTSQVYELANRYKLEMPIIREVYAVLYEHKSPQLAFTELMSRDVRPEE